MANYSFEDHPILAFQAGQKLHWQKATDFSAGHHACLPTCLQKKWIELINRSAESESNIARSKKETKRYYAIW